MLSTRWVSLIDKHMGKILSMLETAVRTISPGNYQESWDMYIRSWLLSFFSDRKCTSYPNGHWVRNSNGTLVHGKPRHFVIVTQQTRNALKSHDCDFGLNVCHVIMYTKIVAIMYRSSTQSPLLVKHRFPRRRKIIRFDGLQLIQRWWLTVCLLWDPPNRVHYNDVIISVISTQITGVSIVCSTVCSGTDQRKHQSCASLTFMRVIHRWLMDSPHKGPVTRKMFPFDDVTLSTRPWYNRFTAYHRLVRCRVDCFTRWTCVFRYYMQSSFVMSLFMYVYVCIYTIRNRVSLQHGPLYNDIVYSPTMTDVEY